jgi:hypothetical protein
VDLQRGIADGIHPPEAHPGFKIPRATWIANAAAGLAGRPGEVTPQAESAQGSRQTGYDHPQKVQAAGEAEHAGGPRHAELIPQNQGRRQQKARLWDGLAQTLEFPASQPHQFAVSRPGPGA